MLLTNYDNYPQEQFSSFFKEAIEHANSLRVASGYVGEDVFISQVPLMKKLIERGGIVQLIFGISLWDGVTEKCEKAMREFHDFAVKHNTDSGVFVVNTRRYHGKVYNFGYTDPQKNKATVGSSNFSPTGFGTWRETNIVISDPDKLSELNRFFYRLKDNDTVPITLIGGFGSNKKLRLTLRQKDQEFISEFSWPAANAKNVEGAKTLPVAFSLPLRPGQDFEKSSLNLFNGPGRKNSETGKYTPRGWYEIENTVKKDDPCRLDLNSYLPPTMDPWRFKVVTEKSEVFEVNFNRKYGEKGDTRTLKELGVDFQSSKRRLLGYFIKDQLVNAGVLDIGETITKDTLDEYGNNELIFKDLGNNHFYMMF